jgi:hypothetical protein
MTVQVQPLYLHSKLQRKEELLIFYVTNRCLGNIVCMQEIIYLGKRRKTDFRRQVVVSAYVPLQIQETLSLPPPLPKSKSTHLPPVVLGFKLYSSSRASIHFCSGYFGNRVLLFSQAGLDHDPPILHLLLLLG